MCYHEDCVVNLSPWPEFSKALIKHDMGAISTLGCTGAGCRNRLLLQVQLRKWPWGLLMQPVPATSYPAAGCADSSRLMLDKRLKELRGPGSHHNPRIEHKGRN